MDVNKINDSNKNDTFDNLIPNTDILSLFEDYFDKLKPLLIERYESDIDDIKKALNEFNKQHKHIIETLEMLDNKAPFKEYAKSIFAFANALQNFNQNMKNIIVLFNKPYLNAVTMMTTDMSQTYRIETIELFNEISQQYENYKRQYQHSLNIINQKLVMQLLEKMKFNANNKEDNKNNGKDDSKNNSKDDSKEKLNIIQELFHEYKAIDLYVDFMQTYIDYLYDLGNDAKQVMFYALELIEQDKDLYLIHADNELSDKENKTIHLHNPFLHRYGLVANTTSLDVETITEMLCNTKYKSIEDFIKNTKMGVIVMSKIVPIPVEYNIRMLFQQLPPVEIGINKTIVESYKTIQYVDQSKNEYGFDMEIHNKDRDKFYILDTLNGSHYRILTPYFTTKVYLTPKYRISMLLKYIEPNEPNRITNYQLLANEKAISSMFAKRLLPMDYLETESKNVDTSIIRNELYLKLTRFASELIRKQKPKSQLVVNEIIHDDNFQEIFIDCLYSMFHSGEHRLLLTNGARQGELLSSFLVGLRDLARQFFKLFHDGYNREPLGNDIFKISIDDRIMIIEKKIHEVILKCLNLLIGEKDNIYASVNYKYLLLTFQ